MPDSVSTASAKSVVPARSPAVLGAGPHREHRPPAHARRAQGHVADKQLTFQRPQNRLFQTAVTRKHRRAVSRSWGRCLAVGPLPLLLDTLPHQSPQPTAPRRSSEGASGRCRRPAVQSPALGLVTAARGCAPRVWSPQAQQRPRARSGMLRWLGFGTTSWRRDGRCGSLLQRHRREARRRRLPALRLFRGPVWGSHLLLRLRGF